jgi:hypothetical protein
MILWHSDANFGSCLNATLHIVKMLQQEAAYAGNL